MTVKTYKVFTCVQCRYSYTNIDGGICSLCEEKNMSDKTLENTKASQAKDNVSDIEFYGDGDLFKCLSKAWSKKEKWMKSTKAMNVPNGVVIQVTTQQGKHVAEAVCFVPGVMVAPTSVSKDGEGGYELIALNAWPSAEPETNE